MQPNLNAPSTSTINHNGPGAKSGVIHSCFKNVASMLSSRTQLEEHGNTNKNNDMNTSSILVGPIRGFYSDGHGREESDIGVD